MPAYNPETLKTYLEGLGSAEPIYEVVKQLIEEYKGFIGNDPEFVFVENIIKNDGLTELQNLSLVTRETYADFLIFSPDKPFFVSNIGSVITRISIPMRRGVCLSKSNSSSNSSRLTAQFAAATNLVWYLNASGKNCEELLQMIKTYFVPALKR